MKPSPTLPRVRLEKSMSPSHEDTAPPLVSCSLLPDSKVRSREVTCRILKSFGDARVSHDWLEGAGAGAWLDEALCDSRKGAPPEAKPQTHLNREREGDGVRIVSRGIGFAFEGSFRPCRSDCDGPVVRLSDRECGTVIYADFRSPWVTLPWKMDLACPDRRAPLY